MVVLFVAALEEESAALTGRAQILHVGVGKVEAATRLAHHLAGSGDVDLIVNIGTAGGLRGQQLGEVAEVRTVFQHDFDREGASAFVGRPLAGGPIELTDRHPQAAARLASGDRVITDAADRDRLAVDADLVDMEGYAVAAAGARFGIPVRIAKAVSDSADIEAAMTWPETLTICSAALATWAQSQGLID